MPRVLYALAGAVLLSVALAAPVFGAATTLERPSPSWYTPALHSEVLRAGADGVRVGAQQLNTECPGLQSPGVSAGGCIVEPAGCTANFIFTDGTRFYIGTARHCVENVGDTVVMQVETATIAAVGPVVKLTSGDGEPGEDFALVRIEDEVADRWGVNPAIPFTGGPMGVYDGCAIESVSHYGHGYGVAVAQGKPETGIATNWHSDGYGWTGAGLPGDSGSPVVLTFNKRAAGNFTHLIVDTRYPASNLAGMRMTAILDFLGSGYRLVNADGSTSYDATASCTTGGSADDGDEQSSGRGDEKGNGNGKGKGPKRSRP